MKFIVLILAVALTLTQGRVTVNDPSSRPLATGLPRYKEPLSEQKLRQQTENCDVLLSTEIKAEIESYRERATSIITHIMDGPFKGRTYEELDILAHKYPVRLSGTQNLEDSIDFMMEKMRNFGFKNVRGEQVLVPHWVRGEESAQMILPWKKNLPLLGLGTTVGTPEEGITADVIAVQSFAELDARAAEVAEKIVVYNQGWGGAYGHGYTYRNEGASRAAIHGAVGVLLRSVCPFSLETPHTGGQNYFENVTQIPIAAITVEDAEIMWNLAARGERVQVTMILIDYNLPMTTSRKGIGEIGGEVLPNEYVAVTGHIDSWDVGQGVMDDAGGVMISVMALAALHELGLSPKRRLQAIMWTSEEPGLWGVEDFVRQHEDILPDYSAVFESDGGTFDPQGLDFGGIEVAGCIINEILKLTADSINTTMYQRYCSVSSDISRIQAKGVPGVSNMNKIDMYFWYHHTEADTMTMMDSTELDRNTAMWAVSSYIVADLNDKLPRGDNELCNA